MRLPKYTMGIGDRFGQQGAAQLDALIKALKQGVMVFPVWNKSWREHSIIETLPRDVRTEADAAVAARSWEGPYFVDADHVSLTSVEPFLDVSDFFTLDVADQLGAKVDESEVSRFVDAHRRFLGRLTLPVCDQVLEVSEADLRRVAEQYLASVRQAGCIYRRILQCKSSESFVVEVSMDEAETPQTPLELFFILSALADEGVPVQTIAPKFSGRFNKGVDYVGDVQQFTQEFQQHLAVIRRAVEEFSLPANLKLSIHSGSDKFSLYEPVHESLRRFDAGVHVKTAGTTWLEELVGLAMAGSAGVRLVKEIYAGAVQRIDELTAPYATVIDIDRRRLPDVATLYAWDGRRLAATIRHAPGCPDFNPHVRQLLHVAYKLAAERGDEYLQMLRRHRAGVGRYVTENLYQWHIRPLFVEQ